MNSLFTDLIKKVSLFRYNCQNLFSNFMRKNLDGFTLAEVLITLGIIGVVAAMTIPTLMANTRKSQIETALKKDYATIQQAMRLAIADGLDLDMVVSDGSDAAIKEWFITYLEPHMKISKVCYNKKAQCRDKNYISRDLRGDILDLVGGNHIAIILNDGSYIGLDVYSSTDSWFGTGSTEPKMAIVMDVNGPKPPNVYGKDIHIAVWLPSKSGIVPSGSGKTKEELDKYCRSTGEGSYCLQKVINDGWKIDETVWNRRR